MITLLDKLLNTAKFSITLSLTLVLSQGVYAHTYEAHTHGEARMAMIYDEGVLLIEIQSPAENILGFEHFPQSKEEQELVNKSLNLLDKPEKIIELTPGCVLKNKRIVSPFLKGDAAEGDSDKKHQHADEHKKQDVSSHKEFKLHYEYSCKDTSTLNIRLRVFEYFNGFKKVHAQWIAFSKQGMKILNKKDQALELTK